MSTSLIKPDNAQLVTYREDQISLIKDTFAKGATDSELKLFIAVAERKGLDIFSRQVHLVKRYDKKLNREVMEVQAGIDGYRLIAERTGRYEGQIGPHWCGNDGNWKDVWLAKEPPAAARVGILKSGAREPFYGIALYREYVQTYKEGNPFPMWAKMPANQLAKCAEALALRKAFPGELSGIYTQEEMAQAHNSDEVIDVEPIREEKPVKPLALVPPVKEAEPAQEASTINDPLPETPNTQHDDEEAARIEQEHSDLNIWIKAAWQQAGGTLEEFEIWTREKDLYNATLGWKRGVLEKLQKKAAEKGQSQAKEAKRKAISKALGVSEQLKSNETASGFAAQREDGAVKVLRTNEDGELEAQWEKPVEPAPEKKSKLKAVIDEVVAEHFPNTSDGYSEGYKAARAFVVSIIGEFKNFDEINKADEAKAIAALSRWNPADEGKGKK